jgi:hypothetical protein
MVQAEGLSLASLKIEVLVNVSRRVVVYEYGLAKRRCLFCSIIGT